jgi:hypothetical protein
MDANQATGAASGLLLLGLALTGALFALTAAAPSAAAHEDCYSLTPTGCGKCDTRTKHSHYLVGPAPVPWCLWDPAIADLPCLDLECPDRAGFRLSGVAA